MSAPLSVPDTKLSRAGQYQYPFQFELPSNLPPSLKFSNGSATCALPAPATAPAPETAESTEPARAWPALSFCLALQHVQNP